MRPDSIRAQYLTVARKLCSKRINTLHEHLAILENTNQQNSNGLHHFGIQTEDLAATIDRVEKAQPGKAIRKPGSGSAEELWLSDASENHIYLSVNGTLEYRTVEKYANRK